MEGQVRFKIGMFIGEVLALGLFGPWDDFLGLGDCLLRDCLCKLPAPAVTDSFCLKFLTFALSSS
jgi:hypothetical protein